MATISLPYKLQVYIPEDLRYELKTLAHEKNVTLQELVNTVLRDAVTHAPKDEKRQRRAAVSA